MSGQRSRDVGKTSQGIINAESAYLAILGVQHRLDGRGVDFATPPFERMPAEQKYSNAPVRQPQTGEKIEKFQYVSTILFGVVDHDEKMPITTIEIGVYIEPH